VIFDLHCHTHCSDGALSPEDLILRAAEKDVSVLSITDHDTIAGWQMAESHALKSGIKLIPGIEFSSQWSKGQVHIVGLNISTESTELLSAIEQQSASREQRSLQIAAKLSKLGIEGALEGARAQAGNAQLTRPHFAHFLVEKGYAKDINAAFKKYLGQGKPADVKYQWPSMQQVIGWIKSAGGIAVLAHPARYDLTRTRMCKLVEEFVEAGGQAMEVISGFQTSEVTKDLSRIANQYDLYASCGSDFHYPNQHWHELGAFGALPDNVRPVWNLFGF
jgi:predicted metal-dependent phosphoesterase TrpH